MDVTKQKMDKQVSKYKKRNGKKIFGKYNTSSNNLTYSNIPVHLPSTVRNVQQIYSCIKFNALNVGQATNIMINGYRSINKNSQNIIIGWPRYLSKISTGIDSDLNKK